MPKYTFEEDYGCDDGHDILYCGDSNLPPATCAICGGETVYFSAFFETPLCSPTCTKKMWRDFIKANRESGP